MSKPLITLEDHLTSSGKYPDRVKSTECTQKVKDNAVTLLARVNAALLELGVKSVKVSSGFRTQAANAGIANAAKKSYHVQGMAIDLEDDKNQTLCKLFTKEVLEKHGLRREDSDSTIGKNTNWCHLDIGPVVSRRIFKP